MHVGMSLGERYVLVAPELAWASDVEQWEGSDTRLDRPVTILVVHRDQPTAVLEAAERARPLRDGRLARIVDIRDIDDEEPAFVVYERPDGVTVADVLADRRLPPSHARALIGEAADALATAASDDLAHGGISPELVSISGTGRVVVTGIGVAAAILDLGNDDAQASDAAALARLLVDAVADPTALDVDAGDADLDTTLEAALPEEVDHATATLVGSVLDDVVPSSAAEIVSHLAPWRPRVLRGLPLGRWSFPLRFPPIEPAAEPAIVEAVGLLPPIEPAEDEGAWEFELLIDEADEGEPGLEVPSLAEALLSSLQRRHPDSERIARLLERAQDKALGGPRFNALPVIVLLGLTVIVVTAFLAISWIQAPYVPDIDLNKPPPQHYPEFTHTPQGEPTP